MKINGSPENSRDNIAIECYAMLKSIYDKEYSEIMNLCYGLSVTILSSIDNKIQHSIKPEQYFILNLDILREDGSVITELNDCFRYFTKEEELVGENAWYNERTGEKEDIKKRVRFWNFPQILVITLKRFSFDGTRKINSLVNFPLENLDLSEHVIGYNAKTYVYDLFGICNHTGGVMGGHYTSFVKNSEDQWLHYNDTNVERVDNLQHLISQSAYCLFYRKKS